MLGGCFLCSEVRIRHRTPRPDQLVEIDVLAQYETCTDKVAIDEVPEAERNAVAADVAERVVTKPNVGPTAPTDGWPGSARVEEAGMKRHSGLRAGRALILAAVALSLAAAACASGPRQTTEPVPVACTDASLLELRAVHPDSLSERGWQQLQTLERECSLAREAAARESQGWTADHHRWWMASGLAMGLMMLLMWSPW